MSDTIRAFLSYSHDSPEHGARVLGLSERLRKDGIDTGLDQYVNGVPCQGWPRWMLDELDTADFVLLVCTETYYRRFRGHEEPDKGKGADWEGALITQEIYDTRSRTVKFVPVLFDAADARFIPEPLRSVTYYTLTSGTVYQALYDFLLGQAGVEPGVVGDLRRRERKRAAPLTFPAEPASGDRQPVPASPPVAPSRLRHSAERLIGRDGELARLDAAWADPATNVLTIVAFGGEGKTSLVAHWQARLAQRGFDGAAYFDWSFYSQGTREEGGASADAFVRAALEFFGDSEMAGSAASPWDKGARLAQLVATQRTLLVLDGLEPLQYPPGPLAGELREPAVAALLKGVAQRNSGLCVVTTREHVSDIARYRDTTAPELELHRLSPDAGVDLLRTVGVKGNDKELHALVEDVRGHALTLNLIGRYLARAHGGDIRKRDRVRLEKADAQVKGGHAFKAMAAYERWLVEGGDEGARQLAILRLMGLFDRPADAACVDALRRAPAIAGLTEPIVDLLEEDWNLAVAALSECGLVSAPDTPGAALEAHPLIREYFAKRLRDGAPDAWKAAHSRLYEHLRDSVEHRPNTLEGLQPLYQAIAHGCYAHRYQEACDSVYWDRILRRSEDYSTGKLGAFGADVAAVACFFDQPWTRVSPLLKPQDQGWLLAGAAFSLRALGRLTEALQPMRAGLAMAVTRENWRNAAIAAGNVSELELIVGDVSPAVADARQAVTHADRSDDAFHRMAMRTTVADALHQAGRRDESLTLFREAEDIQAEHQPKYPLLYSFSGFRYCDLLLSQAERAGWRAVIGWREDAYSRGSDANSRNLTSSLEDVARRGKKVFGWHTTSHPPLDIALDHLTLGRAWLYLSVLKPHASLTPLIPSAAPFINPAARDHLDAAVDGFRRAGTTHFHPMGLLSRAWLRFLAGESDTARTDLDDAWEIAERGPMRLYMADIHLYRAGLFHAVQPYPWDSPHADLAAARRLIEECGYWRRKEELEDAEQAAKHW